VLFDLRKSEFNLVNSTSSSAYNVVWKKIVEQFRVLYSLIMSEVDNLLELLMDLGEVCFKSLFALVKSFVSVHAGL
jgi:hypothetical protein